MSWPQPLQPIPPPPPKSTIGTCKTCAWYRSAADLTIGTCHARTPHQPVEVGIEQLGRRMSTSFPVVYENDFCREYTPPEAINRR
jgi:hypothetical protein